MISTIFPTSTPPNNSKFPPRSLVKITIVFNQIEHLVRMANDL
jgi:hypothetical protein